MNLKLHTWTDLIVRKCSARVAQWLEGLACNWNVVGSIPVVAWTMVYEQTAVPASLVAPSHDELDSYQGLVT